MLAPYRAYEPTLGRWLNRDPIGERGGVNLYGYVGDNPVNFVDPDGLQPTIDPATGAEIGRFIVDSAGNTMIEPVGGSTSAYPPGSGSADTHTYYPNGSNYQRLNPNGHATNPTPHGHGHLPGTGAGRKGQGASIDPLGNIVKSNSSSAHWKIAPRICPKLPGILMIPGLIMDFLEFNEFYKYQEENSSCLPYECA